MKISDIMRQPAVTISASASIAVAAERMRERNVGILTVLDQDQLVGVVTDRDIVLRFVTVGKPAMNVQMHEVMSPEVQICFGGQAVEDAATTMGDHQLRRLPVLGGAKRLVGILSVDKIAEEYSEHLAGETLGEIVETRAAMVTGVWRR